MGKKVKIKIKFVGGFNKTEDVVEVDEKYTYVKLLESLKINPETVVVVKDGLPVPTDETVSEGEITLIRVISGG